MTNQALVTAYLAVFWPVLAWGAFYGIWRKDWCVLRSVALMVAGQLGLEAFGIRGDNFPAYAIMFGLTAFLSVVRPAGVYLGIFGAINIAGAAISIVGGIENWTAATKKLIWNCFLALSWLELIVIIGGAGGGIIALYIRDIVRLRWSMLSIASRRGSVEG